MIVTGAAPDRFCSCQRAKASADGRAYLASEATG
jgi:hypothetical protein